MWDRRLLEALKVWARVDEILAANPYTYFSVDTSRDWDDAKKRIWRSVFFKEGGKVIVRAHGATRDEAMVNLVQKYDAER